MCSQLSSVISSYSNESLFIDKVYSDYNIYSDSDNKTQDHIKKDYSFEINNTST